MVSSEDDVNSGALDEQTHSTERDEAVETSAAAVSVDSPETDSPESEEGEDADSGEDGADGEDESGIKLTRRGALAAITAAIGGVSAGILNTNETPEIEAFGYGGAPVSSNESATANATNGTTSADRFRRPGSIRRNRRTRRDLQAPRRIRPGTRRRLGTLATPPYPRTTPILLQRTRNWLPRRSRNPRTVRPNRHRRTGRRDHWRRRHR